LISSFGGKIAAAHFCALPGRWRELGCVLAASHPDATNRPDGRTPAAQLVASVVARSILV
jgi:hypothetical protein